MTNNCRGCAAKREGKFCQLHIPIKRQVKNGALVIHPLATCPRPTTSAQLAVALEGLQA